MGYYTPGTILKRKTPLSKKDAPFVYDRVEVINDSPVQHPQPPRTDENGRVLPPKWTGRDADGVLIRPAGEGFGSNLDEPTGKLRELYEIESIPDPEQPIETIKVIDATSSQAGPTPEEVFAAANEQAQSEKDAKRKKAMAKPSPLDGPAA